MSNTEEDFDDYPIPLVELIAENMEVYAAAAGVLPKASDGAFYMSRAAHLLRMFEAIEGHPATDYLEVEQWSMDHQDEGCKFLVLPGGGSGHAPE